MKSSEHTNLPSTPAPHLKSDGALNKATVGMHNAVDKVTGAAEEMARKAAPGLDRAADFAHRAVDNAAAAATPVAEWFNEQAEALNAAQKKLVSSTRDYVSANPLKALGIALAAGFLASRLFRK